MLPDDIFPPVNTEGWLKHFEVLADALATPGISAPGPKPDTLLPVNAPEWLWEAWEAHELVWQGLELTFAQIHALPDTEPGECPAEEEYVFTREEIDRDRDFEGGSADDGWDE